MWRRQHPGDPAPTPREALEERLSAYLDGEVTAAEAAQVEALLSSETPEGREARAYLDDLTLMTSALASIAEVKAPRSFAIPASASGTPSGIPATFRDSGGVGRSVALVRRLEWALRASAAAAALFFVVAVVSPSADTPMSTSGAADAAAGSAEEAMTTMQAPAPEGETLRASGEDGPAPSLAPLPEAAGGGAAGDPGDESSDEPGDAPSNDGDGDTGAQGFGTNSDGGLAEGDTVTDGGVTDGGVTDEDARTGEARAEGAAFAAPEAGTVPVDSASDGVGGVTAALGVLAVLLTALSVLMARSRATNADRL